MADYQEYRRRILHRRWRRMFITAALLILLVLLAAVGVLWKRLHREPAPNTAQGPTILQQELTGSEWNTISYTPARRLSVQTLDNGMTAMDFRLAAQPASSPGRPTSCWVPMCLRLTVTIPVSPPVTG